MLRKIPPVGSHVFAQRDAQYLQFLNRVFRPYSYKLLGSGTAALAMAFILAKQLKNVKRPEVLIPAYACPDLLSAADYAGVKAVLVDLQPNRPWMELDFLRSVLTNDTVAILGVNFFGISERAEELKKCASAVGALYIEDSALDFPTRDEIPFWHGDLVVLSFGRGKPVNNLGGGALLLGSRVPSKLMQRVDKSVLRSGESQLLWKLKRQVFNALINPSAYWLTSLVPFLRLGVTEYVELKELVSMPAWKAITLPENIRAYFSQLALERNREARSRISEILKSNPEILDLPSLCGVSLDHKLLRYPVLLGANDGPRRSDRGLGRLQRLGCSRLYQNTLVGFKSAARTGHYDRSHYPNAISFSERLLTLPTHQYLTSSDLSMIALSLRKT